MHVVTVVGDDESLSARYANRHESVCNICQRKRQLPPPDSV